MTRKSRGANFARLRRTLSAAFILLGVVGLFGASFAQDDPLADLLSTGNSTTAEAPATGRAVLLELTGAIGPALAHYIVQGIEDAQGEADLIVLEMDTPGGLDTSMREIIRAILASNVPVATYVSPSGARAASAGAFILYASHIAAMAPGTAVGAATPIQMGGESPLPRPSDDPASAGGVDEEADPLPASGSATAPRTPLDAKAMNDAAALARGLAELRGRNAEFAETMIREAESVSSGEALERGVIEFVARNLGELLEAADGMVVEMADAEREVHSRGLVVERIPMNWVQRLITMITDPNVAFILMNFGFLGILIEFYNPGAILPGVAGVICLILALYALSVIPFSATGLALVLVGLLLMGAELFVISGGVLAIGGFISFAIGAFFLFDSPVAEFNLDWRVLVGTLAVFGLILALVITYALSALGRKITSGSETLIGMKGTVVDWVGGKGTVFLDGENWQSRSNAALQDGQAVIAVARDGNVLIVEAA